MVVTHLALINQPSQSPSTWKDRQQRKLGQRDSRRAVVDQHDVIARQRELVATTSRCTVDSANVSLTRIIRGVFDAVPGLVGELAKIDFVGMA